MKDFTGRTIEVGDTLAMITRPSSGAYLYSAEVIAIEVGERDHWVVNPSGPGYVIEGKRPTELLTLKLTSNGRIQKDKHERSYEERAVIISKAA